jgi:Spy/CpxP family protein refolding chaperone
MKRIIANRLACWTMLGVLAVALAAIGRPVSGTDADPSAPRTTKKDRKRHWPLPRHYKDVVTDEQKQKIQTIQDEYRPKIQALEKQLKDLRAEEMAKIEAVLTPEQKDQIKKADDEAMQKAKQRKAARSKAAQPTEKGKAEKDKPAEQNKPTEKDNPAEKDKTSPPEPKPAA